MKNQICALPLLALLTACQQLATKPPAVYRPEEAGTVDHAMCLLGFEGIPLRELATGHHLIDVTLNGQKATFVLDTGANKSVLHAPYAERLGIGEGAAVPGAAIGLGGAMKARQVEIERMEIGGLPIRQSRIMSADLSQLTRFLGPLSGSTIYGLIGQDVMKEHRAVIDVAKPILYLVEADEDPAPVSADRCRGEQTTSKAG
jgi:clan AA aspartic protease (TIGR02281 family)